jgi:4-hydroxy-3-methylbut-2-enyl diphosphate reductase IspH
LHNKVLREIADRRFRPATGGVDLRIALQLGMDEPAREALARLERLAADRKVAVVGRFMPDRGVSARLAAIGVRECVDEADFFRFRSVAIPFCGVPARRRREWEREVRELEDLTSPEVKRAQAALGRLKIDGAQGLVIGHHDDAETDAISGGGGACVLEDTTDTSRLRFAPAFGAVCQTTLSPRRVSWLVQQLRLRWRDARVTFLDTVSPAMIAREEALERLLVECDRVVIVGEAGESSCEALAETATRKGRQVHIAATPDEVAALDFRPREKVALTAGAFATDEAIRAVAGALVAA